MELGTTLIVVLFFIILEAFFSGCEIGFISINRLKVQQKATEGSASAKAVLDLLASPEKLFATTSLGTNLSVVCGTAVFTAFMMTHLGEAGDFIAMLLISPFILFGGEIIPKIIFRSRADTLIPALIVPLNILCKILSPLIKFFTFVNNFLLKTIFRQKSENGNSISREQIQQILRLDAKTSDLDTTEKKLIARIFNFSQIPVDQCMVPLVQIQAIEDTATMEEVIKMANEKGFSRFPVFHERMFNLIGILNTFDLLNAPNDDTPITGLIRPAYYVPPNKKIDDLLNELQQRGLHMAVIVDEYGGCIGLATVEDLLEEIVGEIEDEYDEPEKLYKKYADEGYLIDGDEEIAVINERLDLNIPVGNYETLAGLLIEKLEKIPVPGDQVTVEDVRLTVKDASKRKINTVILRYLKSTSSNNKNPPQGPPPPEKIKDS